MPRVSRLSTWRRPDHLHGRADREQVAARPRLLGHVALADEAAGHELALLDRLAGLGDQPGEELQGADLESDGVDVASSGASPPAAVAASASALSTPRR